METEVQHCAKVEAEQVELKRYVKVEPQSDGDADPPYDKGQEELFSPSLTFVEVKTEIQESVAAAKWTVEYSFPDWTAVRKMAPNRRTKDAERQRYKRLTEPEAKRAERLRKDAERKRFKRAAELQAERARRLCSNAVRRSTESEGERSDRLRRDAERQRFKRASESGADRAKRLCRDNERKRLKRATESEAERAERLRRDTERKRFKRAAKRRLVVDTENGFRWKQFAGLEMQTEHSAFGPLLPALPECLDQSWRTYGTLAQSGTRENFLGTRTLTAVPSCG